MSAAERFLSILSSEIEKSEAGRIFDTAEDLIAKAFDEPAERKQGLLFGQIQSGKTNNIIMSIAQASDKGIRFFVVLTSDNTLLYDQTVARLSRGLPHLLIIDKSNWDEDALKGRIKASYQRHGVVFCSTKNRSILIKLINRISALGFDFEKPALIFDDEADQASLNTETNSVDSEPSAVCAAIQELRNSMPDHRFVQVTATPQALFLQSAEGDFKPDFVVTFPPGKDYIGGEHFFPQENRADSLIRLISESEPDQICGESTMPGGFAIPTGIRQALCAFLVGASIKGIRNEGSSFSSLLHISYAQSAHHSLERLVNSFLEAILIALGDPKGSRDRDLFSQFLLEARSDLEVAASKPFPEIEEIIAFIDNYIVNANVQVLNSQRTESPNAFSFFNFFIGGNRLGRGVTIPHLITTYYGRNTASPKLDTMLQHARMYGYRASDLDVIRFFTTPSLYELFKNIHDSDRALRASLERINSYSEIQAIMLNRTSHGLMRPTRSNVIPLGEIKLFMPGTRYFPHSPLVSNVSVLDKMLMQYDGRKELTPVKMSTLIDILNLTSSELLYGEAWSDEAIRTCVASLKEICGDEAFLAVRTDRDIKKDFRAMLSPDDQRLYDKNAPTLIMYRFRGSEAQGWEGKPFWVPNFRFPDGSRHFIFTPT